MCGFLWSIVGLSLFLLRNESITSGFSYKLQRVVALANDANYFAAALLIWIQFAFFWFIRKNAKNKFTILLSLITMSMAVIFSYSRGAWLGLAFMFFLDFVMFLIYLQKLSSMADLKKVAFSIFIISVLAGGVFATFVSLQERMESVSTEKNLGAGRVSVWNDAIIIVKDNPITGVGLNNYKLYTLHNRSGLKAPGSAVHNVFLNILVETGIFGFLIYIFFLGTIFVKFRIVRYIQNESIAFWFIASFGAIVTQLICSLFISNVYEEPFYIIIALFLALYNLHIYSSQEIAC
jgi:O-antigen ligase